MPIDKEIGYYKDVIVSKLVYIVSAILLKSQWDFTWNLIKCYIKTGIGSRETRILLKNEEEGRGYRRLGLLNAKLNLKARDSLQLDQRDRIQTPTVCGNLIEYLTQVVLQVSEEP